MPKIFILTEGGGSTGMGHVARCLSIYQTFEARGYFPEIIINGNESIIPALDGTKYLLFDWVKEQTRIIQHINNADIVLVDSYYCPLSLYQQIAEVCKLPVFIDDNVRVEYPRGIVVNGVMGAENLDYPKSTEVVYLLGIQYAFLRSAFWNTSPVFIKEEVESIMVSCGGNDVGLSTRIVKILLNHFPNLRISVVLKDLITNDIAYLNKYANVLIDLSADKMKTLMGESDIAITAAGQTTYELCRLGTPFIALLTADNQKFSITNFFKAGLVQEAIMADNVNFETLLINQFEYLLDKNSRTKFSTKMQQTFSGNRSLKLIDYIIEHTSLN